MSGDFDQKIIGRKPLIRHIDDLLDHSRDAATTPAVALHGMGGVGKTALARLYAQERRKRFEGVWWLPSEQVEETLVPAIDALGRAIGAEAEGDSAARAAATWDALAQRGKPWLLVFDNAPDYATVRPWLAHGETVRMLVTSRQDDFPPDRMPTLHVDALSPKTAADLLEREARREGDRAGALALADALDGLPLALVVAAAYARETGMAFADLAQRIDALCDAAPPADYPASIAASLELTLARLDADSDTGPDEWALLRLLPWLAPEGIDAKLVLDVAERDFVEGTDVEIPETIHALAADPARLHRALTRLEARALATVSPAEDGPGRTAALHRVTALVLRRRLAREESALRREAAAVVAAGYPGGAQTPEDSATWPACARLNPHVAALAADPPPSAAMEFLLNQAALFWGEQAETETALAYARAALALTIARLEPDHPEVGIGHGNLGSMLSDAGRHEEAVAAYEEALRIAWAQVPGYPHLGAALSNLAESLKRLAGETDAAAAAALLRRAEGLQRRSWAAERRRFPRRPRGADGARTDLHVDLAIPLNNLADSYALLGRPRRALCFAAAALRVWRDTLPPGDHRIAFSLNNLGAMRLEARAPAQAAPLLREALEIREAAFPDRPGKPPHSHRVATAQWLAACLFALDPPQTAEAEALCARYGLDPAERRARAAALMAGG